MQKTLWIDYLGTVHSDLGRIGTLVCGPVSRDGDVVYVLDTYEGRAIVDWKDVLIQRAKNGAAEHYRGNC